MPRRRPGPRRGRPPARAPGGRPPGTHRWPRSTPARPRPGGWRGRPPASTGTPAQPSSTRPSTGGAWWTWDHLLVPGTGRCRPAVGVLGPRGRGRARAVRGGAHQCGAVAARLRSPVNARPVLLAAVDGEQHSLPLVAVAAALAERRVAARLWVPRCSLGRRGRRHEARRAGRSPAVGSQLERSSRNEYLSAPAHAPGRRRGRGRVRPGWCGPLPPGVAQLHDLGGP